jgi:hypothetical protein
LGIELQIAAQKGIPIVICFNKGKQYRAQEVQYENPDKSHHQLQIGEGYVTLMALGLPTVFRVLGYRTEDKALCEIRQTIGLLKNPASKR